MTGMKASIKAGDLRYIRLAIEEGLDGCQIMRLVQRSQWNQLLKLCQNLSCQHYRFAVTHPAVHHPVTKTQYLCTCPFRPQPGPQCIYGSVSITDSRTEIVLC